MIKRDSKSQIIVKFTSNWPTLFKNLQKYSSYITHAVSQETQSQFTLEVIEDGVIYIYNTMDIFKQMNQVYTPEFIIQASQNMTLRLDPDKLLEGVVDDYSFPPEGIHFQFKYTCSPEIRDEVRALMERHYKGAVGADYIESFRSDKFDLIIRYKSLTALKSYINVMALIISGLLHETQ